MIMGLDVATLKPCCLSSSQFFTEWRAQVRCLNFYFLIKG